MEYSVLHTNLGVDSGSGRSPLVKSQKKGERDLTYLTLRAVFHLWVLFLRNGVWGPLCQAVVNGHHHRVLQQLGQNQQWQKEDSSCTEVFSTGSPGHLCSLMKHRGQVVFIITFCYFFCNMPEKKVQPHWFTLTDLSLELASGSHRRWVIIKDKEWLKMKLFTQANTYDFAKVSSNTW